MIGTEVRYLQKRIADTFSALLLPNLSGEISSRCRRSQAWQRCDSEAQLKDVWRCVKMWKQVGLLIQICLVYMYDCMYVSWNMLVYFIIVLFCEYRWSSRKVVWKQRWKIFEVKMLRNLEMLAESQEELGSYTDALSTPRVESCTGWYEKCLFDQANLIQSCNLLYMHAKSMSMWFITVRACKSFSECKFANCSYAGTTFLSTCWGGAPKPLALWLCMRSIFKCRRYSNLLRSVTWLTMTGTAFLKMCKKSIDRRRMFCFLHLDLIPSIQRNYAKLIGLVSTKACWKHKQHDNCRHSAWHSYIVSSFIKLLQWRCKRWKAYSVQATHQNHTVEDLRQATR